MANAGVAVAVAVALAVAGYMMAGIDTTIQTRTMLKGGQYPCPIDHCVASLPRFKTR